ncbi:Di-copper centre-containing protein [Auricularia subglabra TFB-10046 SS5]|nr:Di-copper centre-containing protein [Auricularia subglabra TFB-10046 SS5]
MRLSLASLGGLLALAATLVSATVEDFAQLPAAAAPEACHSHPMRVRREWGGLSRRERRKYIDAVLCLQHLPSRLDHALYNSTTRYEDFVVVHINSTRFIHRNGVFLSWHRGYIKLFESALQTECGYAGTLPYWDWVKHAQNLEASPLFDGSDYSFSGNGIPTPPETKPPCRIGDVSCPPGTGGGCVPTGPFKDYRIGYAPVDIKVISDPNPGLPANVFAYNSTCFPRDLNQYIATQYQTRENVRRLMSTETIEDFQAVFDSRVGLVGLHPAGHVLTGPVNGNFFSSPQEPTFFLHHASVDRAWSRWQMKDLKERVYGNNAIYGTVTTMNIPPSANATFDTLLNWGPLGEPQPIVEVIALGRGGYCYRQLEMPVANWEHY